MLPSVITFVAEVRQSKRQKDLPTTAQRREKFKSLRLSDRYFFIMLWQTLPLSVGGVTSSGPLFFAVLVVREINNFLLHLFY